jgi:hypothetical protein
LSAEEILLKKNELLKDINGIEIEKPSIWATINKQIDNIVDSIADSEEKYILSNGETLAQFTSKLKEDVTKYFQGQSEVTIEDIKKNLTILQKVGFFASDFNQALRY